MVATQSLADTVAELAKSFTGQLLLPVDPDYDQARRVHNGLIDRRPALVARCRGVSDVVDAVRLARDLKLEVAVRGGGHNVAGRSTTDGGVMIDLASMTGIHVDPKARTARAQGGAHVGSVQPRNAAPWAGDDRRCGLDDRHCGPDARRWPWLADGQACAGARQPAFRRPGAGGRKHADGQQGRERRLVLGPVRRRRQLRRGDLVRISPASGRPHDHRRRHRLPIQRGMGRAAVLPRRHRLAARRTDGVRRPDPCAGRIRREAGGDGGVSLRVARRRREWRCSRSSRSAHRRWMRSGRCLTPR